MTELREVDRDSSPSDHLGDYVELGSPYPASEAARRGALPTLPGEAHADPAEVAGMMAGYAAVPHKTGTQVRPVVASQWFANSILLPDGANGMKLLDFDPQRLYVEISNHSGSGDIYIANSPSRTVGAGTLYIPARQAGTGGRYFVRTLRTTAEVWLFTVADFIQGATPVTVQVYGERLT